MRKGPCIAASRVIIYMMWPRSVDGLSSVMKVVDFERWTIIYLFIVGLKTEIYVYIYERNVENSHLRHSASYTLGRARPNPFVC